MIRAAMPADAPQIVSITRSHFHKLPNRLVEFNETTFAEYVRGFLATRHADRLALVSERRGEVVGFIFCVVIPQPLTGKSLAMKCIWCARDDAGGHGVRLHRAAERWAAKSGADRFMSSAFDPRTEQLLLLSEYHETERIFEKLL